MKIILTMAIVLILSSAPTCYGLGVEGVIFDAEVLPGQHVSHEITASLREDEGPMDLQVEVLEWGQSLDGSNQELDSTGIACYSAKEFLRASPESIHLKPGDSQKILIEGDIPADVGAGGRYALISVHSQAPDDGSEGSEGMVGVAVAINSLVRLIISGSELQRAGEISDIKTVGPIRDGNGNISLIFKNTGNCHYKAQAEAALVDGGGNTIARSKTPLSSNIIPCASRIFTVPLLPEKDLSPGTYRIVVAVKGEDGGTLATEENEAEI